MLRLLLLGGVAWLLLLGEPELPGRRPPLFTAWRLEELLLDEAAGREALRLLLLGVPAFGVCRWLLVEELWVDVWLRLPDTGVRASTVAAVATISATAAAKVKILAVIASSF